MIEEYYYVYILTNKRKTVLYTGVTKDLIFRLHQHRNDIGSKFVTKYKVYMLVYFEIFTDPENAIQREKQIKAGSRKKKEELIVARNSCWQDISCELL